MAEKIKLVQGDTRPNLICHLTDENTGTVIPLVGATVVMKFRESGSIEVRATITGIVFDPPNGIVVFSWGDTPEALTGEPGDYEGEIAITYPDGTTQTVYDVLKFKLREEF